MMGVELGRTVGHRVWQVFVFGRPLARRGLTYSAARRRLERYKHRRGVVVDRLDEWLAARQLVAVGCDVVVHAPTLPVIATPVREVRRREASAEQLALGLPS